MTQNPVVPPPIPSAHGSPAATSRRTIIIVLVAVLVVLIFGVGIVAAILIPTVGKVRETARRTVDASNIRQIIQASLIYAAESPGGTLPPIHLTAAGEREGATPATIEGVMAALAREGGLDDPALWRSASDAAPKPAVSFDYATGLTVAMPPTTPVAWTRGLREDGTWDPAMAVYGRDGGHVAFLGGNVTFFRDLRSTPLLRVDGTSSSNILDVLPASARVVGSGPGSLNGSKGRGPARSP